MTFCRNVKCVSTAVILSGNFPMESFVRQTHKKAIMFTFNRQKNLVDLGWFCRYLAFIESLVSTFDVQEV